MSIPRTLDVNSTATLPGGLEISRWRYRAYFADWWWWLCSFFPAAAIHWPLIGKQVKLWVRTREHMRFGDLIPAVIHDKNASLVAAYTNLRYDGEKDWPVIRIYKERLGLLPRSRVGDRLAVVALYRGTDASKAKGHWLDIYPIAAGCLASAKEAVKARSRISEASWEALRIGLETLPPGITEGLYPVQIPDEIVREA
jgi:hypothetical protein